MVLRRAALAFLFLAGCNTAGSTRPVNHEESTLSSPVKYLSDESILPGSLEMPVMDASSAAIGDEPTTERIVGYVAIIGGVLAFTILAIGFYKLARLLAH
jgi:hypothetical protein